jgi:hypothetical protein
MNGVGTWSSSFKQRKLSVSLSAMRSDPKGDDEQLSRTSIVGLVRLLQ